MPQNSIISWPATVDVLMSLIDGWTPITAEDLEVYQDLVEKIEEVLGGGYADQTTQSVVGPKASNADVAERLNAFLEPGGQLKDISYTNGEGAGSQLWDDTGLFQNSGEPLPFGKDISGNTKGLYGYFIMFQAQSPGNSSNAWDTDTPSLWWVKTKESSQVRLQARDLGNGAYGFSNRPYKYQMLAIGQGAFAVG